MKATGGFRIRYVKHSDDLLVSLRIYSDGKRLVKIVIDKKEPCWKIVDAATGYVYEKGGEHITNLEVLMRAAKRELIKFIKTEFKREFRATGQHAHLTPKNDRS